MNFQPRQGYVLAKALEINQNDWCLFEIVYAAPADIGVQIFVKPSNWEMFKNDLYLINMSDIAVWMKPEVVTELKAD